MRTGKCKNLITGETVEFTYDFVSLTKRSNPSSWIIHDVKFCGKRNYAKKFFKKQIPCFILGDNRGALFMVEICKQQDSTYYIITGEISLLIKEKTNLEMAEIIENGDF